jgi:indolepyruvate ferredoxin oxidoreductase beta subunit
MNVVLLGAMAEVLQLDNLDWDTALKENVPERFIEINQEAFKRGRELARSEEEAYAP